MTRHTFTTPDGTPVTVAVTINGRVEDVTSVDQARRLLEAMAITIATGSADFRQTPELTANVNHLIDALALARGCEPREVRDALNVRLTRYAADGGWGVRRPV